LLLGYFALQVLIRTLLSASVDLDESEQVMLSQKFSWGYGSDPPLYVWLQMGFFAVFGRSVFALALFKDLLLLATYGFAYGSTRLLTRNHLCGAAAALSLLFIPHVVWESQRDLTHSVLASASSVAALFCFLRAHESRRAGWYVAFGLCCGVGLQAKYNFGLWAVGLLAAALTLPEFRGTVLSRRMLLGLAVGIALVLPTWFG
jgi:lipopolysaccharide core galacturonosyltransferase RgtB